MKEQLPPSEDLTQSIITLHFWNTRPETRYCLRSIPNGSSRDFREASKLLATGQVAGAQDIEFFWSGKVYPIEIKTEKGTCSCFQKATHSAFKKQGFDTWLIRSSKDGIEFITAIINGDPLYKFDHLISPYSNAEMLPVYLEECKKERLKKYSKQI